MVLSVQQWTLEVRWKFMVGTWQCLFAGLGKVWNPPGSAWHSWAPVTVGKENPHGLRTCSHSPAKFPNATASFQSAAGHIKVVAARTCSSEFFSPSSTRTTTFQISDWRCWALQIVHTAELRQERAARVRERRLIYITLHPTCCNLDGQRPPFGSLPSQSRDDSTPLQSQWRSFSSFSMIPTLSANDPTPALPWHPQTTCRTQPLSIPVCAVAHFFDP